MENPALLPTARRPATGSLAGRLINIFAAPDDVFDEVKTNPLSTANWLVPVLVGCLVGIVYVFVAFSQESVIRSVHEMQEARVRKQFEKQVQAGKMSREQADRAADQALQAMEQFTGPTMMKVFGSFGAVGGSFLYLFVASLVIWLLGAKLFKRGFPYMKAVEAVGLAGMINVLGGIVAMLLVATLGNMAMTPGPVLLVREYDYANPIHRLLSQINVVMLWYLAVLALGLAKLGDVSYGKAAAWLFGIWGSLVLLSTLPGWGR
jgi:Yip1 domain